MREWDSTFEDMFVVDSCYCGWIPDTHETIIAYGPKKYDYSLSLESSFPQHTWFEIHKCPKCGHELKIEAESC
jgi:hypothetical protein